MTGVVLVLVVAVVVVVACGVLGLAVSHLVHELSALLDSLRVPQ